MKAISRFFLAVIMALLILAVSGIPTALAAVVFSQYHMEAVSGDQGTWDAAMSWHFTGTYLPWVIFGITGVASGAGDMTVYYDCATSGSTYWGGRGNMSVLAGTHAYGTNRTDGGEADSQNGPSKCTTGMSTYFSWAGDWGAPDSLKWNADWAANFSVAIHRVVVNGVDAYNDAATPTPTFTPTPTPGNTTNFGTLRDGDMEQRPASQYWGLTNPNAKFGRLFDSAIWTGSDACSYGSGYQGIGNIKGWPWEWGEWGSIYQTFAWPGGTMYWSATAWGMPDNSNIPARMVMYVVNTSGSKTVLLDENLTANWTVYTGTLPSLASGAYQITIENAGSSYDTIFVDDVALEPQLRPITCSGGGGIPNGDATATPSPTPYSWNEQEYITNCDFEGSLSGWNSSPESFFFMAATNHVLDAAPVGPVGPNYVVPDGRNLYKYFTVFNPIAPMWQSFYFNSPDPMYFTFWAYGDPLIKLKVSGVNMILYGPPYTGRDPNAIAHWERYQVMYYGLRNPTNFYDLMLFNPRTGFLWATNVYTVNYGTGDITMTETVRSFVDTRYDGFSIGSAGYVDTCSQYPTATPNSTAMQTATPSMTPTPSKTPTGTIRPSWTPRNTLVPSATRTPLPTWTPGPTRTQRSTDISPATSTLPPTWTGEPGGGGTYTPYPTGTPWPTYTPFPTGTPAPWGTPPPSDDPGPDARCEQPDDWFNVSAWVDFETCRVFRWLSWSEENDGQVTAMAEAMSQVEPYGAIAEGYESALLLREIWNSYDWINTGYEGKFDVGRPKLEAITLPALDGNFSFEPDTAFQARVSEEVTFCKARTNTVFGQRVAEGMCIVWTYYYLVGIVQWIQFGWDLAVLVLLVRYFYRALLQRM